MDKSNKIVGLRNIVLFTQEIPEFAIVDFPAQFLKSKMEIDTIYEGVVFYLCIHWKLL